jgi:hypothetical protein
VRAKPLSKEMVLKKDVTIGDYVSRGVLLYPGSWLPAEVFRKKRSLTASTINSVIF